MTDIRPLHPAPLDVQAASGVRLRVWDYGGSGPPLLLCHCTGTIGRIWEPVIARLSVDARILAMDLRGHGDSDKPRGGQYYRWERYGEDVLAVAEGLALGADARAVGHSGGAVAVMLAQLARPGVFSSVVLVDAILATDDFFPEDNPRAAAARRRKENFASREEIRDRLGAKYPFNAWAGESFDAYVAHGFNDMPDGTVQLKCPAEVEAEWYESGSTERVLNRMVELKVPLCLVSATESYMLQFVQEQHRLAPGSRLDILEGVGHFIPQEQPQRTADLLTAWFA